jgi:hypothetical protein
MENCDLEKKLMKMYESKISEDKESVESWKIEYFMDLWLPYHDKYEDLDNLEIDEMPYGCYHEDSRSSNDGERCWMCFLISFTLDGDKYSGSVDYLLYDYNCEFFVDDVRVIFD